MIEQRDGFIVDDRRGQPDRATVEPTGEIVTWIDGVECVFRMVNGVRTLIRKAGHEVTVLTHSFESCEICGSQHLRVGDETVRCARTDWTWTPNYGPGYGPRGMYDNQRQLAPEQVLQRNHNLDQLAKLIGYTGP